MSCVREGSLIPNMQEIRTRLEICQSPLKLWTLELNILTFNLVVKYIHRVIMRARMLTRRLYKKLIWMEL